MAEPEESAGKDTGPEPEVSEDDRRAAAAAANRKRALDDWEEKKKRWRQMGVPPALPAKK
ncbi:MAG TPA: hypothetical protein VJA66_09230 [Thermoanaerobaculia bacterium]